MEDGRQDAENYENDVSQPGAESIDSNRGNVVMVTEPAGDDNAQPEEDQKGRRVKPELGDEDLDDAHDDTNENEDDSCDGGNIATHRFFKGVFRPSD